MLLSFPFGILAQMFRAWRWKQTLEPLGEHPRTSICVHSIFISYASSLIVPRIGEFARCGVLKSYDGVSFPKALGTVVTERAIDSLLVLIITGLTILFEMSTFGTFFEKTGTSIDTILQKFSPAGYFVTAVCGMAALMLVHLLLKRLSIYNKVKTTLTGIWQGVLSMKNVKNVPLFIFFTLGIWLSYFLHYYLTFFCFDFTEDLWSGLRPGNIHRRHHSRHCSHAQWCGSVALCRKDDAHPLRRGRCQGPLFRTYRAYRPDDAGDCPRHLFCHHAEF